MHDDRVRPPADEELTRWIRQHPEVWHHVDARATGPDELIDDAWFDDVVDRTLSGRRQRGDEPARRRRTGNSHPGEPWSGHAADRRSALRSVGGRGPIRLRGRPVLSSAAAALCVLALGAALLSMRGDDAPPPAIGSNASTTEILQPQPPTIDLTSPSEHPIDGEWRAIFNASVPGWVDTSRRLAHERGRRLEACMRGRGFDFSVGRLDGDEIDWRILGNPLRADTIPLGYHLPPEPRVVGSTTEITPEMEIALDGGADPTALADDVPPPCNVDSEVNVLTPLRQDVDERWMGLAIGMGAALDAYSTTPEATTLSAAWSECMSARGYQYTNQVEPRIAFAEQPEVTDLEVATRTADYECDRQVGLTAARSAWQRQEYERWRTDHAAEIQEFAEAVDELSVALGAAESDALVAGVGARSPSLRATPSTEPDEPIDAYEFLIGYDPAALFLIADFAQGEYTTTCMIGRGFDATRVGAILDDMFARSPRRDDAEKTPDADIGRWIADIENGLLAPAGQSQHVDMSEVEWLAFDECQQAARVAFPNPNDTLFSLIGDVDLDVSARVSADPRIVVADAEAQQCIADTGYPAGTEGPRNNLYSAASEIVNSYVSGAVPRATALQQLNALAPIEAAMLTCEGAFGTVLRDVHSEIWQDAIATNQGLIAEVRDALDNELAIYR